MATKTAEATCGEGRVKISGSTEAGMVSELVNHSNCAEISSSASSEQRHYVDHRVKPGDDELCEIYALFVIAGLDPAIHVGKPPRVPAGLNDTFTRSQSL